MDNRSTSFSSTTVILGIVLMILGLLILGSQVFTTFVSVLFLGWMLLIGGIVQFIYGFFSGAWSRFFLSLIGGAASFIFGLIIVSNPALSVASLTLLIGIMLLIGGAYKTLAAIMNRGSQWGWVLTAGIVSFLLGISILAGWPYSGLWVIGLFIGIELLISGFALVVTAYAPADEERFRETRYLSGVKGGGAEKKENDE